MSMPEMIARSAANTSAMVRAMDVPDLSSPTTCAKFDFAELANHLTSFLGYSANSARRGPEMEGEAPNFAADPDWPETFAHLASDLADAWSQPGATAGTVQFGPGELPAEYAASITLLELVVHGWDLAMSSGTSYSVDDDIAAVVHQIVAQAREGARGDAFADPVTVPDDASPLDQTIALSGRNPG